MFSGTVSIFVLSIAFSNAQHGVDRPPPTISANRKWFVWDKTPVGQPIGELKTQNADIDIVFGLEQSVGFNIVESKDQSPLPFTIDSKTGIVRTNESLVGKVGKDYLVYVTAYYDDSSYSNSHNASPLTTKFQIWVKVVKTPTDDRRNSSTAGSPYPYQHSLNYPSPSNDIPPIEAKPSYISLKTIYNTTETPTPVQNRNDDTSNSTRTPASRKQHADDENTSWNTNISKAAESEILPTHEPTFNIIIALVPAVFVLFSLFLSALVACLFRKRICKKRNKINKDEMKKSSCSGLSVEESIVLQHWRGPRAFGNRYDSWDVNSNQNQVNSAKNADKWEIPRHHIKVFNMLGEGFFGQVFKCEALNIDNQEGATIVAVKMLKENAGERERQDLLQELQVMKMLDPHPNVVRLLGCCTDRDPIFVIMEYAANGKLQSFLRNSRAERYYNNLHGSSSTLTSKDLTSFCLQIAKGMEYLSTKGIVHRDLAARNILVCADKRCKVADFGLARDVMSSHVYERKSEGRLPIRWMAPESLYDNLFSTKSDIWSFGILLWEIVTLGSTPYPAIPAAEVMRRVSQGYRLDKPHHCRRELYNIMYYCWAQQPDQRPTFQEVVQLLDQLLVTDTDYIHLDNFPDHSYYNMVSLSGEKL